MSPVFAVSYVSGTTFALSTARSQQDLGALNSNSRQTTNRVRQLGRRPPLERSSTTSHSEMLRLFCPEQRGDGRCLQIKYGQKGRAAARKDHGIGLIVGKPGVYHFLLEQVLVALTEIF